MLYINLNDYGSLSMFSFLFVVLVRILNSLPLITRVSIGLALRAYIPFGVYIPFDFPGEKNKL